MQQAYQLLGLRPDVPHTADEIRRAYQKQALIHHPDKGGSHEKFLSLGSAYELLQEQSCNIGGDSNDRFYRYKRDRIQTTYDPKKNITQMVNMETIMKQLKVPKSFGDSFIRKVQKKIGTQYSNGFRGRVSVDLLEQVLERMIGKYVICPFCNLPELRNRVCNACGFSDEKETKTETTDPLGTHCEAESILKESHCEAESIPEETRIEEMRVYAERIADELYSRRDCNGVEVLLDKFWVIAGKDYQYHSEWKAWAQEAITLMALSGRSLIE